MARPTKPLNFADVISATEENATRALDSMQSMAPTGSFQDAYTTWVTALQQEPAKLAAFQQRVSDEQARIAAAANPAHAPADDALMRHDKRFAGAGWQTPAYRTLAESYLSSCRLWMESIDSLSVPDKARARMRFFVQQYLDALSPTNFLATNPDALAAAVESKGESLKLGLENLRADADKGRISMTDENAFAIGENVALTPGAVVFENEIFQLIQYTPSTPHVFLRPLLMVPPCINKFYILDLRPQSSLIEYALAQGFTVFITSWRNVGEAQGKLTWDDYLANGVIKAIDTVRLITNVEKINALGFCVGGTMLACALAVLRRMGYDVVESATFLTTFVDFDDVGDIRAYVDEAFLTRKEREVGLPQGGIVSGRDLSFAFSSLRANDLVWNYVVDNYLKGKKPAAFDLLYWNSDSTNLPGPWYCWYLRNTYAENNLIKPEHAVNCGVPVDLHAVDMPTFIFAAREDHIVPWRSAYLSTTHFSGEATFVLGASGHIAGVVNPASKNKRSYWKNANTGTSADQWFDGATEVAGSWWPCWTSWLSKHSGRKIEARKSLGSHAFPVIEAAPGRYVKDKIE